MADIDVVPKHRSNTWLWIVLIVAIALVVIWMFASRTGTVTELQQAHPALASLAAVSPDSGVAI
jgi:hypothetical protein